MAATYSEPTSTARWADLGTATEPSASKKASGWVAPEPCDSEILNWLLRQAGDFTKWIDERFSDGIDENEFILANADGGTNPNITISDSGILFTDALVADSPISIAGLFHTDNAAGTGMHAKSGINIGNFNQSLGGGLISIVDQYFYLRFFGTKASVNFDNGDALQFDQSNNRFIIHGSGIDTLLIDGTNNTLSSPGANFDIGKSGQYYSELYAKRMFFYGNSDSSQSSESPDKYVLTARQCVFAHARVDDAGNLEGGSYWNVSGATKTSTGTYEVTSIISSSIFTSTAISMPKNCEVNGKTEPGELFENPLLTSAVNSTGFANKIEVTTRLGVTKATSEGATPGPWALAVGGTFIFEVNNDGVDRVLTIDPGDFPDINNVTPLELKAWFINELTGFGGSAFYFNDQIFVMGDSVIECKGGTMNAVVNFPLASSTSNAEGHPYDWGFNVVWYAGGNHA